MKLNRLTLALPALAVASALALAGCSDTSGPDAGDQGNSSTAHNSAKQDSAKKEPAKKTSAKKDSAKKEPVVGEPFTVEMGRGNVAKITIVSAERTQEVGDPQLAMTPDKGRFLVLDVLWETESGKTTANPLYFNAKDAEGRKGDFSPFSDKQLASGEVLPGDKSRGEVVFDIAPGPATVTVTDQLLQEKARITIND